MQQADMDTLARLTFNAVATREFFGDRSKGVKLRIEGRVLTFHSSNTATGAEVIAIERKPRGLVADVPDDRLSRQVMQRLFRAGLTEDRPYFVLEATSRGWFGVEHVPEGAPPQRQSIMVVSHFDPPPVPIDMAVWTKFRRTLAANRSIDETLWNDLRAMLRSAIQQTRKPQRGRVSEKRALAEKLLGAFRRSLGLVVEWRDRQPEHAPDITAMLKELGIKPSEVEHLAPEKFLITEEDVTHVPEAFVERVVGKAAEPVQKVRKKRATRRTNVAPESPQTEHEEEADSELVTLPNATDLEEEFAVEDIWDDRPRRQSAEAHEPEPAEAVRADTLKPQEPDVEALEPAEARDIVDAQQDAKEASEPVRQAPGEEAGSENPVAGTTTQNPAAPDDTSHSDHENPEPPAEDKDKDQ